MKNYVTSNKKERALTMCNSMEGPGECDADGNKPVRERQVSRDPTHIGI